MRSPLPAEASFELLDFVPLGIIVLNSELRILFWNACLEEWTHIPRQRVIDQTIDSLFPHLGQPKYLTRLSQIFEGGQPLIFSSQLHPHLIPIERPDEQLQVQYTTVTAIPGSQEGEFYALWSIQDVTDLSHQILNYKAEQFKAWNEVKVRQQAEAALKESEERWHLALRGNNDGIWDWNVKTNEVFFSSRWKEMLGFEEHEIPNHVDEWGRRVHPDDISEVMQLIQDHFAGKTPFYSSEHRILCKDGSYKWILDRGQALWDETGQVIRMVGSHTDITERKQAEVALQESERKYRHLINHIHAGFVVHGPDTRILQCNAIACDLLGLSMDQMLGRTAINDPWFLLREDETPMTVEEYPVNRVLATRTPLRNYVVGINRGAQSKVWALVTAFPEFDSHDQVAQVVVTFIDISELKQAEADLRTMAEVMENAVSGISKLDLQGRYLYVNKAYADITGYQPEEMIGMPWQQTVQTSDLNKLIVAYEQMQQDGQVEVEAKGIRQDGSHFYKQLVLIAIYDEQHQFAGHYCFMKDITDRKQAEEALEKELLRNRILFNTSMDGIVVLDDQGQVIQNSPSFAQMLGYTMEEMAHLSVADWDAQWTEAELKNMLQAEAPPLFETQHRRKDGSLYDVEISYSRVQLDGEMIHFCICRNISERKRTEAKRLAAEAALATSQKQYQNLVENSPDIIERFDLELRHLYVSPALTRITGIAPEAFLGKTCGDLAMDEEMVRIWETAAANLLRTGQKQVIEFLTPTLQGVRLFEMVIAPELSEQQTIESILCISRDITERQQVEAALRESEATKQAIIQAIPDLLIRMGSDGSYVEFISNNRFTRVNPACQRQNSNVWDVLPSDLAQRRLHYTQQALQAGTPQIYEQAIVIEEKQCYEEVRIVPLQQDEVLVMVRDITDRKQAEIELQAQKNFLQQVIDAVPSSIFVKDTEGRFLIVNQAAATIYGVSFAEMLGQRDIDLNPNVAQTEEFTRQNQLVTDSLTPITFPDQAIQDQAGITRWYQTTISPFIDADGQPKGIIGNSIEVSDRKQAEIALQLSQERLELALEASGDGLWDWNIQTGEVYHSPRYYEILGYETDSCMIDLQKWKQILHPDERDWVLDRLKAHLQDSSVNYVIDYRVCCQSGEWKWVTDYGKVVTRDMQGHPLRMIGAYKDISERKQKEQALQKAMEAAEAANLAKSLFLANMSHELRTPLNIILGFTQVMAHDPSLTPNQREDLLTIRRSGDHLLNLINDVLDLSKIEAGHFTLEKVGFDLIALLHTLRSMMTERANAKHIQLEFNIAPEVPQFILADEQKLRQILLNLLSNAIKFTNQGSVTLTASVIGNHQGFELSSNSATGLEHQSILPQLYPPISPPNDTIPLQFEITDTGIGIETNEQKMIFDAFIQAEAGRKAMSGTGLGLTISRKLVELMNGTISVRSVPNLGSTFTLIVPVQQTSGVDIYPEHRDRLIVGLAPGQAHRRILVVDDQRENRLVLVRLLNQLGLETREASDGQEAIRIWREWQPDLTWMDIRMPGLDGYEATRQIRAEEQRRQQNKGIEEAEDTKTDLTDFSISPLSIPSNTDSIIIALTAQASQSDRTLALAAGCNDYISKPFREETLFLKLKEYLGLEYLYAESHAESEDHSELTCSIENSTGYCEPHLLTSLSPEWLASLENAAICGNDREIKELAAQLPPELDHLSKIFVNLADQYQFEQILQWVNGSG